MFFLCYIQKLVNDLHNLVIWFDKIKIYIFLTMFEKNKYKKCISRLITKEKTWRILNELNSWNKMKNCIIKKDSSNKIKKKIK